MTPRPMPRHPDLFLHAHPATPKGRVRQPVIKNDLACATAVFLHPQFSSILNPRFVFVVFLKARDVPARRPWTVDGPH